MYYLPHIYLHVDHTITVVDPLCIRVAYYVCAMHLSEVYSVWKHLPKQKRSNVCTYMSDRPYSCFLPGVHYVKICPTVLCYISILGIRYTYCIFW